ncbi:hypothetical protein F4776DRAFT_658602 [Hypoxylon sp. NC0597]|nr:hypothetical protein F4776DRAFT_658602 [Hypoxylon sp. NC0597]
MEAIVQPSALKPGGFLGAVVTLCSFTATVIGMRLWSNFNHSKKLHIDDSLNSDPQTVTIEDITILCALGIFSGNIAMYTAKLPLLFLFIRLFGVEKWLRWTCRFLIVFGLLGFLTAATYTSVSCSPQLHIVAVPFLFKCVTAVTNGCISRGSLSLTMDLVMFVLPLPVITKLKLPLRRKLGLVLVFMTGLLAIAASALGLYFQTAQSNGTSTNFANALLITVVESCIVLLVGCSPALHLFWTTHAASLFNRFGLSRLSQATTKTSGSSKHIIKNGDDRGMSASDPINVTTHHYIELKESPMFGKQTYEAGATAHRN